MTHLRSLLIILALLLSANSYGVIVTSFEQFEQTLAEKKHTWFDIWFDFTSIPLDDLDLSGITGVAFDEDLDPRYLELFPDLQTLVVNGDVRGTFVLDLLPPTCTSVGFYTDDQVDFRCSAQKGRFLKLEYLGIKYERNLNLLNFIDTVEQLDIPLAEGLGVEIESKGISGLKVLRLHGCPDRTSLDVFNIEELSALAVIACENLDSNSFDDLGDLNLKWLSIQGSKAKEGVAISLREHKHLEGLILKQSRIPFLFLASDSLGLLLTNGFHANKIYLESSADSLYLSFLKSSVNISSHHNFASALRMILVDKGSDVTGLSAMFYPELRVLDLTNPAACLYDINKIKALNLDYKRDSNLEDYYPDISFITIDQVNLAYEEEFLRELENVEWLKMIKALY